MPTGSSKVEAIGKCCGKQKTYAMQTIDKVLSARNLTEACSEVVKNKGAGGADWKAGPLPNGEALTASWWPGPVRGSNALS